MTDMQMTINASKTLLQTAQQFSDVPSAVWEYVVNSLGYRGNPDNCNITVNFDEKKIIISDNSDGMNEEILKSFFTVSGENLARQGKQKAWNKRGLYGTGKLAAFGIANKLTVETVQNGIKNKYSLTREQIENNPSDAASIPLEKIVVNQKVKEPNGTKIYIEDLNIKVKQHELSRKIEREIKSYKEMKPHILINDYKCEIKELDIDKSFVFEVEGSLKERYGDATLTIETSKTPLDKSDRGVLVYSNQNHIGTEGGGVLEKECGNYLTGKIDLPKLEEPINNIPSINQSRQKKLNSNHQGVKDLIIFIEPKLEYVRKKLVDERTKKRNTAKMKKLSSMCDEIGNLLNSQFTEIQRNINDTRREANSEISNSIFNLVGDDDNEEAIELGEDFFVDTDNDIRVGEKNNNHQQNNDNAQQNLKKDIHGDKKGKVTEGKKSKRKRGGFIVDHDNLGFDEQRSIYDKEKYKIIINMDHPSLVSCLRTCKDDVENITFKRLAFEIAIREFEHTIAQEKIHESNSYPAIDLLFEMRAIHDKVSRNLPIDLYGN